MWCNKITVYARYSLYTLYCTAVWPLSYCLSQNHHSNPKISSWEEFLPFFLLPSFFTPSFMLMLLLLAKDWMLTELKLLSEPFLAREFFFFDWWLLLLKLVDVISPSLIFITFSRARRSRRLPGSECAWIPSQRRKNIFLESGVDVGVRCGSKVFFLMFLKLTRSPISLFRMD